MLLSDTVHTDGFTAHNDDDDDDDDDNDDDKALY